MFGCARRTSIAASPAFGRFARRGEASPPAPSWFPLSTSTRFSGAGASSAAYSVEPGFLSKFYRKLFQGGRRIPDRVLHSSGCFLANACTSKVDVESFFEVFRMPDTFFSWFLVTELHVWMMCVRAMVGKTNEGERMRYFIVKALWEDMAGRAALIGGLSRKDRNNQILDMAEEFQTAVALYDIGNVSDDKMLADVLWKRFFGAIDQPDPEMIANLVKYVRKTMAHLDNVKLDDLLHFCDRQDKIQWLDLKAVVAE